MESKDPNPSPIDPKDKKGNLSLGDVPIVGPACHATMDESNKDGRGVRGHWKLADPDLSPAVDLTDLESKMTVPFVCIA